MACSGVRSLIGVRLLAVQANAVFDACHQFRFTTLVIVAKSRSVGMANRQRPPLREAHTAPTALLSSASVHKCPPFFSPDMYFA